ncbi:HXXEE domain-containing protein [Streptomyces phyllanthi]|uniref:HXXEE domain-containing protein n=1 Tax=Streptomyces phyllanthi TaxID=1803180 RepID=A0A5N8VWS9_9ACTN|nr:HXXEE domain-containing protein [Streptomyces phyllanthi]MPY39707.1 HXXEE domain-containing protein [Streptomyces phyllanthi]
MAERVPELTPDEASAHVPAAAIWGLLIAFAVHDAEELATMSRWSEKRFERLRARHPGLPPRLLSAVRMSPGHAATAIGIMGAVVAAAAADGARTGGRSGFYQTVLAGFGLHTLTHLGQSALARGYTPGVATAPLVVAPFSCWAWSRLRRAGVLQDTDARSAATTALLFPAVILGAHAGAYGARRLVRRLRRRS